MYCLHDPVKSRSLQGSDVWYFPTDPGCADGSESTSGTTLIQLSASRWCAIGESSLVQSSVAAWLVSHHSRQPLAGADWRLSTQSPKPAAACGPLDLNDPVTWAPRLSNRAAISTSILPTAVL